MSEPIGSAAGRSEGDVTQLLLKWRAGDKQAESRLFELVEPELHLLARRYMTGERPGQTLQPTALLNEAYIKLAGARQVEWQDRHHFYALAARAMRRFLIDRARTRGAAVRLPFDDIVPWIATDSRNFELAISIDSLLDEETRRGLMYFFGAAHAPDSAESAPGIPSGRKW